MQSPSGEQSKINPYLAALLIIATALLQTSVLSRFALGGLTPDLMLLAVVSWSLLRGFESGLPLALAGGLVLDLLCGGPFGALTVSLVLASAVTSLSQRGFSRESLWLPMVGAGLGTLVYDGAYWLLLQTLGRSGGGTVGLMQVAVPGMFLNGLVMYPVYGLLRRLHQRTLFGRAS
jgi:rod shape-determining protein MreD